MELTDKEFARFMSKFLIGDGCWQWHGTIKDGYGRLWLVDRHVRAHRISYELFVGPIPEGLVLDHLCRNKACVRPAHLEAVTHQVNVARGNSGQWNRSKTHCLRGHPYEGDNVVLVPNGRSCRACINLRAARYRNERQARLAAKVESRKAPA